MDYPDKHRCTVCGFAYHAGSLPICPPKRKMAAWPKVQPEAKAGLLFETRVKRYWDDSPGVFTPV